MSKCVDKPEALPFEDLIIQMFNSQHSYKELRAIHDYITRYQYDYCLVHVYTMVRTLEGYYHALAIAD